MSDTLLYQLEQTLLLFQHRKKLMRPLLKRSAVAMILQHRDQCTRILMIKRAECDGDPWSGHMAFPGGRMDPVDRHGLDVATRETAEEVGLHLAESDRCIGRLSEITTGPHPGRRPLVVSPYIFRLDRDVKLVPNEEVAEVVWVPLALFLDSNNREKMVWERGKMSVDLPCYFYQGRRIWGLSLMMLNELLGLLPPDAME